MKILEVKDLSIGFVSGKNKITPTVSNVSFELNRGEILALVGESGCGKSISCMALSKLLPSPPAEVTGSIQLKKRDGSTANILELSKKELRKIRGGEIAYIFQEPSVSLNPVFRIGNQIAEVLDLHRPEIEDQQAEVISLLKKVGIPAPEARMKCYPHELSGGMQQRVMIAMALASNPSVLVADEPTTALDVTIQAQILDLLKQLRDEQGMSIILVTHNLGIVAEMADRVCVMYAGRIAETAPVRELLDNPRHPYTQALLKAVPVLGGEKNRLSTIPGTVPLPADFPAGCRFCDRCELFAKTENAPCRDNVPNFREVKPGHLCACHFTGAC
ncbi:MAG: ABC transporter ATP-binding protein [Lentisphaeria bacterium]|nr:ABC transporter ATP-binding protein [Lentisphaeria bacterium]